MGADCGRAYLREVNYPIRLTVNLNVQTPMRALRVILPCRITIDAMGTLQYEPIHNAASRILYNLSPLGRAENVNEYDFQGTLLQYPELLASYMSERGQSFIRKETNNVDLLMYFYGASQFDIVECKPPRVPIFGADGKATKTLREAIKQALGYRTTIMAGRCRIDHSASDRMPRIIIIGCFPMNSSSGDEEAKTINMELTASEWGREYQNGILIVTTWRVLAEHALTHLPNESLHIVYPPSIKTVARALLAGLIHDVAETANLSKLASPHTTLEGLIARNAALKASVSRPKITPHFVDLVKNRAQTLLNKLDELQLLDHAVQNRTDTYAALQIADIALYGDDRDIPWGHWEHGATYKIIDFMQHSEKVMDEVAPQLLRVLSCDSSEDVLGMASHIARYLSNEEVLAWSKNKSFSSTWAFNEPRQLTENPRQIAFLQVGYCLALHGVSDAVSFMNKCAEDVHVLANIACFNKVHAKRDNMRALLEGLQMKAKSDDQNLRAFRPWHQGVYEATLKMVED